MEEAFQKGKAKIRAGWAPDRIIEETQQKIVVQCENGAYLIYRRMEVPPELKGTPAGNMFDGKVLIQFTEDLEATSFENVTMEAFGVADSHGRKREAKGRVLEALKEFSKRVQIGDVLT